MMTELNVEVVHSRTRARTASLKYTREGQFVLSVPAGTTAAWIENFLHSRRKWMDKTRQRALRENSTRAVYDGARIETEFYSVTATSDATLKYPQYRVQRNLKERQSVFFLAPDFFSPAHSERLFNNLEKYLLAQMIKFGAESLLQRARYWADLHGIRVKEFFVRVQKSRLGYCTHDDRIMLNGRLLFAPQRLRDYVICHELAHTRHRNHSKRYWAYLEKLFPGAKVADKMLRDSSVYSMSLSRSPLYAGKVPKGEGNW